MWLMTDLGFTSWITYPVCPELLIASIEINGLLYARPWLIRMKKTGTNQGLMDIEELEKD
jgi:hypothetical protein